MKLLGILATSFALLLPAGPPGFAAEGDDTAPPPPRLQIINGRSHVIDIFWRTSDRARVAHDAVAASQATVITSTIGHRFSIVGRDHRTEALVTSEAPVPGFRFDPPGPNGVPAISTQSISAHLVDRMLAKRPDVRTAMIRSGPRLGILVHDRFTTDLTEWAHRTPKDVRDARARGMGGSATDPFGSCAEENGLGYPRDPDATESLVLHEFAHTLHRRGLLNVHPASDRRLKTTMALADFDPLIPFDEVVDAAKAVAAMMPREHRCTSLGGLATTPTSLAIERRLGEQKAKSCGTCR